MFQMVLVKLVAWTRVQQYEAKLAEIRKENPNLYDMEREYRMYRLAKNHLIIQHFRPSMPYVFVRRELPPDATKIHWVH